MAPPLIRAMDTCGAANRYAEQGLCIEPEHIYVDKGDLNIPNTTPSQIYRYIREEVLAIAKEGPICVLGGDHAISYPVISAMTDIHQDLHVLHIDAHGDLYENFDDNPFSHASPFARILEDGKIKKLTQVGIRTLSTHQREQAAKYNVEIIEMKDFHTNFIKTLGFPLYISLDIDGIDPAYAPGVSHHEPGGLSTRQVINIIQQISSVVVGCDIVEYNPTRDHHDMTAMLCYKLMKELMVKLHTTSTA